MATAAPTNATKIAEEATKHIEENTARAKEFASALTETTKANTRLAVDNYEKAAKSVFDAQRQLAKAGQVEWIKDASTTQITFAEEVSAAWIKAARQLLK